MNLERHSLAAGIGIVALALLACKGGKTEATATSASAPTNASAAPKTPAVDATGALPSIAAKASASVASTASTAPAAATGPDLVPDLASGSCPKGFTESMNRIRDNELGATHGMTCTRICTSNDQCQAPNKCRAQAIGSTKVCE
jgi:hypothetical protein